MGLADATSKILADESEPSDAGGADFPMPTGPVGHPFERFGAHGTAIVHVFLSLSLSPLDCLIEIKKGKQNPQTKREREKDSR